MRHRKRKPQMERTNRGADADVDGAKRKILDTVALLAERGIPGGRTTVAAWLDVHPYGGRFSGNAKALHEEGFLCEWKLTDKGAGAAWMMCRMGYDGARAVLDASQARILDTIRALGKPTREALAAELRVHPYGGRFSSNLKRLAEMGIVTAAKGEPIVTTDGLFK